ncbi:hypothetical protein J31TS4_32310 [Paenibacillus sp. J31TS4]|uniref:PfkB family carbohydrate kinase n=1 Tax=Paenibacillus sp. J31TS4 TaxID=2807195 RepID=UPI001B2B011B|nr:PfkB family carbohydrate kinase [Paenibacillus sp. J31TS4]GIP39951.1 hypothetical protein J31TS4_32310 [Paenibacillus sp. J31TS4]
MLPSVAVIGTVFVDCKGFAHQLYRPQGRNLGSVRFVHGGVARNVAENLARLDLPTSFLTTVDRTGVGREVLQHLQESGVDTSFVEELEADGMGMWLAILDETGNLAGSISHMPDLEQLAGLLDRQGERLLRQSSHAVLELDLNETLARRVLALAEAAGKPVYGIPGNLDVVLSCPELLRGLACFICNEHEAGRLLGQELEGHRPEDLLPLLKLCADELGLRAMVVTLGERGCVFYDAETQTLGVQAAEPARLVDTSGAGDAFFSGTVMALVRGLPLADAVHCGTKVAAWTIESEENNCRDLRERMLADPLFQGLLVN